MTQRLADCTVTHLSPTVGGLGVLGGDAGENQAGAPQAPVDLVVQRVSAAHLHDVQPARVAKGAQRFVQLQDLGLLPPLVRDEDVGRLRGLFPGQRK